MKKTLLVLSMALGLTACAPNSAPNTAGTKPNAAAANAPAAVAPAAAYDAISQKTKGFAVGKLDSAKVVYVVFDPKCPHCADLWNNAKALHADVKFVWVPVALLSRGSIAEGAALLQAGTVEAMDAHEALISANKPVPAGPASPENQALIKANTAVVQQIQLEGVPYMFYKDPANGQVRTAKGGLPADRLKADLGL